MPKRITTLTAAQRARMDSWADEWIVRGLQTGSMDWDAFMQGAEACYRFANIPWHGNVVRVSSPIVGVLAVPIVDYDIARPHRRDAVDGAVRGAVGDAVDDAVDGAVRGAVGDAVYGAVYGAVDGAVRGAVGDAVDGAVGDAWWRYLGGQMWLAWQAYTSFFREVCGLELPDGLWERDRAYALAQSAAFWWWPYRNFVMVCERPQVIHTELVDPARPRSWNSHRLHCADGPAVGWADGWGVYAWHGIRVPRQVIEAPATLTVAQITAESNAEVRRVMLDRFGAERYLRESGAALISIEHVPCQAAEWCHHTPEQHLARLYRAPLAGDEDIVMVRVTNSTPEPDGQYKHYWIRVPPTITSAREAIAWTFDEKPEVYLAGLQVQS